MTDKIFRLPPAYEMTRRLDDFNPSAAKLHELLAVHGGVETTATGFVLMYSLAVADYTRGLPPVMVSIAEIATHQYAKHLIDDQEALAETLELLGAMGLPNG